MCNKNQCPECDTFTGPLDESPKQLSESTESIDESSNESSMPFEDSRSSNESAECSNKSPINMSANSDHKSTNRSTNVSTNESPCHTAKAIIEKENEKLNEHLFSKFRTFCAEKLTFETDIRWSHVAFMLTVHLVSLHALLLLLSFQVKVQSILFAIFLHYLCNLGLTAGVHRLWSHKGRHTYFSDILGTNFS